DAGAGGGERPQLAHRALQKRERRFRLASQCVDRGGVVAGEWIVSAQPDASVEALERDVERRLRLPRLVQLQVGAAEPHVQLDENAMPQRVLGPGEEIDLLFEVIERLAWPP